MESGIHVHTCNIIVGTPLVTEVDAAESAGNTDCGNTISNTTRVSGP